MNRSKDELFEILSVKNPKSINLKKTKRIPAFMSLITLICCSLIGASILLYGYLLQELNYFPLDHNKEFCASTLEDIFNTEKKPEVLNASNAGSFLYYTNYNEYRDQFMVYQKNSTIQLHGICVSKCPNQNEVVCNYEYYNKGYKQPVNKDMNICSNAKSDKDIYMCKNCFIVPNTTYALYFTCVPDFKDISMTTSQNAIYQQYIQENPPKPKIVYELHDNNIVKKQIPAKIQPIPESTFCLFPLANYKIHTYNTTMLDNCLFKIPTGKTFNKLMFNLSYLFDDNLIDLIWNHLFDIFVTSFLLLLSFILSYLLLKSYIPKIISLTVYITLFVGLYQTMLYLLDYNNIDISNIINSIESLFKRETILNIMSTVDKQSKSMPKSSSHILTLFKNLYENISDNLVPVCISVGIFIIIYIIFSNTLKESIAKTSFIYATPLKYFDFLLVSASFGSFVFELISISSASFLYFLGQLSALLLSIYHQYIELKDDYDLSTILSYFDENPIYSMFKNTFIDATIDIIPIDFYPYILLLFIYLFGIFCFMILDSALYVVSIAIYSWYFDDKYTFKFVYKDGRTVNNPLESVVEESQGKQLSIPEILTIQQETKYIFEDLDSIQPKRTSLFIYLKDSLLTIKSSLGIVFISANISLLLFFMDAKKFSGIFYILIKAFITILSRIHFYVGIISITRHVSMERALSLLYSYITNNLDIFVISMSISKVLQSIFVLSMNAIVMNIQGIFSVNDMQALTENGTSEQMMNLLNKGWLYLLAEFNSLYFSFYFKSLFCTVCITFFITCFHSFLLGYFEESYFLDTIHSSKRLCQDKEFYTSLGYVINDEEDEENENKEKTD